MQRNPCHHDHLVKIEIELEKERIRENIISEEIKRRKLVREQVLRDLAIGRRFAMRSPNEVSAPYGSSEFCFRRRFPEFGGAEYRSLEDRPVFPPHWEVGYGGSDKWDFRGSSVGFPFGIPYPDGARLTRT